MGRDLVSTLFQQCGLVTTDRGTIDRVEAGLRGSLQLGVELRRLHVALGFGEQKRSAGFGGCGDFSEKASSIREFMYHGEGEGEVEIKDVQLNVSKLEPRPAPKGL